MEGNNCIAPITKYATKKTDEVSKASKLFGIDLSKRSKPNERDKVVRQKSQ